MLLVSQARETHQTAVYLVELMKLPDCTFQADGAKTGVYKDGKKLLTLEQSGRVLNLHFSNGGSVSVQDLPNEAAWVQLAASVGAYLSKLL